MPAEQAFLQEKEAVLQIKDITPRKFFLFQIKYHWKKYFLGTLATLITSISEVFVPKVTQWSIDLITYKSAASVPSFLISENKTHMLYKLVALLFVVILTGFWGRVFWRQFLGKRSHEADRLMRSLIWENFRFMPLKYMQKYSLGDLINRSTSDVSATKFIHGFTMVLTYDLIFFTILATVSMLMINVELTLYCLIIFPLLPFLIVPLSKKEYRLHGKAQSSLGSLSDEIFQSLTTIRLQRSTGMGKLWRTKLIGQADQYAKDNYQVVKTAWMIFPLGALPTMFAYIILLTLGIQKVVAQELTVGGLVALLSYVLLLQAPLFELATVITEWQKGLASLRRICEILNLKKSDVFLRGLDASKGQISEMSVSIKNLTFQYPDTNFLALNNISLDIASSQWVGITGKIGAGKSTILSILSGMLDPPPQSVFIYGRDLATANRLWLVEQVTAVPQRSFLFSGTIRHNLNLDQNYEDEELWEILKVVHFADEIRELVHGLDTWIGEWGINLSGGQKQRLSLARSLLRPKSILLLDDCLSAVDADTEEKIIANIKNLTNIKTVIWVAHRHSTLKLCDKIFHLNEGKLEDVIL